VLLKAQAFHAWLGDYVEVVRREAPAGTATRSAKTYANVNARTFGYEASGRVALPLRLYAGGAVSWTRGIDDTLDTSLSEIPPLKASASLRWDDGTFFAEVEEMHAARQDRVNALLGEAPTPGWWITNLRAGGEWRGVKVFAGVRNLLDRTFYEHLSYQRDPFAAGVRVPEPGRAVSVTAQYAY
jgi:iron complex outermembrane recepter protein